MNVCKKLRVITPTFSLVKRNIKSSLKKLQSENKIVGNKLKITIKAMSFTVIIGGCSFVGSTIWQYESLRNKVSDRSSLKSFTTKAGSFRNHVHHYWHKLSSSQRLIASIISVNVVVFCAWRIRKFNNVLKVWFISSPYLGAVYPPMLLSAFSHYSLMHLAANMYVLWSFSSTVTHLLGREQFLSLYITAALVSSFASYVYKLIRFSSLPSLGASGAIMAIIGAVCTQYPNAQLSIIFLDKIHPHSFSASNAMKCIIMFDVIGCFLGWKFIDHAAHLGGMFFGIWYINYGHKYLWDAREPLIRAWHHLRGPP